MGVGVVGDWMYVRMSVHVLACVNVCVYVCTYVCIVCTCMLANGCIRVLMLECVLMRTVHA